MLSWTKGIQIRVRLSPILGIVDFRQGVLTIIKNFSTKTQKLKLVGTGFGFYAKNAVPYKFQNFEKKCFRGFFWIFVLPLTIASRKRVNSGGCPPNAASQKTAHIFCALLNK